MTEASTENLRFLLPLKSLPQKKMYILIKDQTIRPKTKQKILTMMSIFFLSLQEGENKFGHSGRTQHFAEIGIVIWFLRTL